MRGGGGGDWFLVAVAAAAWSREALVIVDHMYMLGEKEEKKPHFLPTQ